MPKPTNLSRYPNEYYALYERLEKCETHTLVFHGPTAQKQALTFRFDLYGFHKALVSENYPKARLWKSFAILVTEKTPTCTVVHFQPGSDRSYLGPLQESLALPPDEVPSIEVPIDDTDTATDMLADMGFKSPGTLVDKDKK